MLGLSLDDRKTKGPSKKLKLGFSHRNMNKVSAKIYRVVIDKLNNVVESMS